jgi:hypothetical protein
LDQLRTGLKSAEMRDLIEEGYWKLERGAGSS